MVAHRVADPRRCRSTAKLARTLATLVRPVASVAIKPQISELVLRHPLREFPGVALVLGGAHVPAQFLNLNLNLNLIVLAGRVSTQLARSVCHRFERCLH